MNFAVKQIDGKDHIVKKYDVFGVEPRVIGRIVQNALTLQYECILLKSIISLSEWQELAKFLTSYNKDRDDC